MENTNENVVETEVVDTATIDSIIVDDLETRGAFSEGQTPAVDETVVATEVVETVSEEVSAPECGSEETVVEVASSEGESVETVG
jgi:hypothetical protein